MCVSDEESVPPVKQTGHHYWKELDVVQGKYKWQLTKSCKICYKEITSKQERITFLFEKEGKNDPSDYILC